MARQQLIGHCYAQQWGIRAANALVIRLTVVQFPLSARPLLAAEVQSAPVGEFDAMFGTRAVEARIPFTRFPTVVSVALHQGTADVDVVRVNDGPPGFDRRTESVNELDCKFGTRGFGPRLPLQLHSHLAGVRVEGEVQDRIRISRIRAPSNR